MGSNSRSATKFAHQIPADLKPFTEVLPPQDRSILIEFTEYALKDRATIEDAASLLPLEFALLVVFLEENKRTQRFYGELCAEIDRLKAVAQHLQEAIPLEEARS